MPPRVNIADEYGSPRYTSIGQTQPDGATAAARKMTRWVDDSSRRRWGELPRGMSEWDYGPSGRPWGAPANSWVFEQERKDIRDRHCSDQAISDWIARTQDAHSMQSRTGWSEAPISYDGRNDTGCDTSTSLKKDAWNDTSQASSRFGYHPLSHASDYEGQSNGWDGNPKRSRAKAQKGRSGWQTQPVCWEDSGWEEVPGCAKSSGWSMESGRDNNGWGEAPVPHDEWKESGWDASAGIGEQWPRAQGLSSPGGVPVSEHFDHEDSSESWSYRPKHSRKQAPKGMSSWEGESERGGNSEWGKESARANDGWGASVKSQVNDSHPGWAEGNWAKLVAWPTGTKSRANDSSSGHLLTPSESTAPSFMVPMKKWSGTSHRQDEEVKDLRRQLAEEKLKNAELGRRLYTLENEGVDPGSVLGGGGEEHTAETAAFEKFTEAPTPPYTPLMRGIKPKTTRKVAISSAETEIFDPPLRRLPRVNLDSMASSLPASQAHHAIQKRSFDEEGWDNNTKFDRYTGIIRDKVYSTRPLTFSMSRNTTFGDILHSWKKRRGIKDDNDLALFREWDGVMSLENTPSMQGITGEYIELDVIQLEKFDVSESVVSGEWGAAGW